MNISVYIKPMLGLLKLLNQSCCISGRYTVEQGDLDEKYMFNLTTIHNTLQCIVDVHRDD